MKILIVSPYAPFPPHAGGRIRIFEEINILSQKHEVAVIYFVYTKKEMTASLGLQKYCSKIMPVLYTNFTQMSDPIPRLVQEYITSEMTEAVVQLRKQFSPHATILQHIYMSHYRRFLPQLTVLEEHNIESKILERFSILLGRQRFQPFTRTNAARVFKDAAQQAALLFDYENKYWPQYPLRITVSSLDKLEMDRRCSSGESIVIENGVNLSSRQLLSKRSLLPQNIVFFGTLDYYPNLDGLYWFLSEILPLVWDRDQNISFTIAGRNPPKGLRNLCDDNRINIVANPLDIGLVAAHSSVSIVPLRVGGGTRLKVLDAMSFGLPVVSTALGCEGLTVVDQENILIRDDAKSFASAIVWLLNEPYVYTKLRTNARKLVENSYTWTRVYSKLEPSISRYL